MRITRIGEVFHVLPYSGGIFDQPGGALLKMEACIVAINKYEAAQAKKDEAEQRLKARLLEEQGVT